ncbi:carbon-nitrogen hydrolase [Patescibacteria group bacterium]|nr:carbon-nitrogen hydrolase [Patescibacteria group bacterium]
MPKLTIALIQHQSTTDQAFNLKKVLALVAKAGRRGAKIIALPELFNTIYFPQYKNVNKDVYAQTIPGPITQALGKLAKKYQTIIVAPIYEKDKQGRFHNSAAVINEQGKLLPTYRKIHIPHDPLFWEKNYFNPSQAGYKIYKTKYATFAVLICFDQWFPEAARIATLKGADLIFYPTAIGYIVGHNSKDGDWHNAWETVMRGHAIANGVHVAAINRTGREDKLNFWGQSFVTNGFGTIIKKASATKEEIIICDIDLSHNKRIRQGWGFLKNRRPDTYQPLI